VEAFKALCSRVAKDFMTEWNEERTDYKNILEVQKRAIIGYRKEVAYFKEKIRRLVQRYGAEGTFYPTWYTSLEDGIYHENWGLAGAAEWFTAPYADSSSAKIIGDRIYFLEQGRMRLMPQTMDSSRREQLVRAFLLLSPGERMDKEFHELYLLDGTRITVFRGDMVKGEQDVIIFRRYTVPNYTFEEQADRGTIPREAIPLFQTMVEAGFNVVFTGPVRSAKTTFLSTWQRYEDPCLEGVMVETDPEIPLHKLMPGAPLVQILADGERLDGISKNLLRSDADYLILAEARDGIALETGIRMAGKGTRRMKMTFHLRDPQEFPYDAAWEIVKTRGGTLGETARKVAGSFDYIFHFAQRPDLQQKKLRGIYQVSLRRESGEIRVDPLCLYDFAEDRWRFRYLFDPEKQAIAREGAPGSERKMEELLRALARQFPMKDPEKGGTYGRTEDLPGSGSLVSAAVPLRSRADPLRTS